MFIFLVFIIYDIYTYKKANIIYKTKIRPILIIIYIAIITIFLGIAYYFSNKLSSYIIAILGALFIIVPTILEGIGADTILYYSGRNRNIIVLKKDIRYTKVYKDEKYTIVEFIVNRGLIKQYYPLEKYEELKELFQLE